ncbi:MAG: hypothetical protein QXT88_01200 [Desulfurococcaceae archaeon]
MKYYTFMEVINAEIYDSEALFYGYLCGLEIRNKPFLKVCLSFKTGEYVPDVEKLKNELRTRGLDIPESATVEELIGIARSEGIKIPYLKIPSKLELVKSYVSLDDVALIDYCFKPGLESGLRIAIVVLNKPREAKYRGLEPPLNQPSLELVNKAKGKIAVSISEGILGFVDEIVFKPGDYGLRLDSNIRRRGFIKWSSFLTILETLGYVDLSKYLRGAVSPLDILDLKYYGLIMSVLNKQNIDEKLVKALNDNVVFEEEYVEEYIDISWNRILKIGDIVLLN